MVIPRNSPEISDRIAFTLWLLATLDAAFAGYREAAGRNALIRKRRYYQRAMIKGVLFGQVAVGLAACVALISLQLAADRQSLLRDYEADGFRMLLVYIPFTLIILLAFLARSIPSVDIRSITSTLIFGPFTLIRPLAQSPACFMACYQPRAWRPSCWVRSC